MADPQALRATSDALLRDLEPALRAPAPELRLRREARTDALGDIQGVLDAEQRAFGYGGARALAHALELQALIGERAHALRARALATCEQRERHEHGDGEERRAHDRPGRRHGEKPVFLWHALAPFGSRIVDS